MAGSPRLKILLVSMSHPELEGEQGPQACYALFQALRRRQDVEATFLAAAHMSTPAVFKSGARISGFDRRPDEFLFLSHGYDDVWHKVGSPLLVESYAEFLQLIRPDVVHFYHFAGLGIDFLSLTRRTLPEARIVFSPTDFTPICAAGGQMVRRTDGFPCSAASSVRCHQCFPERAPELFFARELWMKAHLNAVDVFTAPSKFAAERYATWGIHGSKIRQLPAAAAHECGTVASERQDRRNRFGYFGQLGENSGAELLLGAVAHLRAAGFEDFVVEIYGEYGRAASNQYRENLEAVLEPERRRPPEQQNVVLNGTCDTARLTSRMARIDWCVVPTSWPDPLALVLSQAWSCGRPVIASDVGGMKERVRPGIDGLLFDAGDARSLAEVMRRAASEEGLWDRLATGILPQLSADDVADNFCRLYAELRPGVEPATLLEQGAPA